MSTDALRSGDYAAADAGVIAPFNPVLWLLRALWRYKFLIVLIVGAGVLGAATLAARMPDVYTASGLLEIDPDASNILETQGSTAFVQPETITETEVEVIGSASVMSRVVDQLNLLDAAGAALIEASAGDGEAESGLPPTRAELIDDLQRGLSVTPTGRSYIVRVAYEGENPVEASDIVNAVMAEYLDKEVVQSRRTSRESVALLADRLAELRRDLDAKEAAVLEFRATGRVAEGAGTTFLQEQLSRLNEELVRAQSAQAAAAATAAQRVGPADTLPEVVNSRLIQDLRTQEATQELEVAELQTLYRPNHPRLIQARSALAGLRDAIAAETRKIAASLGAEEVIEGRRVGAIEEEAERLRVMISQQTAAEIELGRLEREVGAAQRIYQTFLDRFNEVQGVTGLEEPDGRVIAAAVAPVRPSGPNRLFVVAGGGIVSGGLAVALAVLLALLDRRVRSPSDIADATGIVPLEDVPAVPGIGRGRFSFSRGRRNAEFAEAITRLRGALVLGPVQDGPVMVAITGVDRDSGAAPLATALAQACAVAGDTAVLVDLNFEEPQVGRLLGLKGDAGVADLISSGGDVLAALVDEPQSGVRVLTAGKGAEPAPYRSEGMDDILDALYENFDVIILLLPPVSDVPDAQAVARVSDVAAVVVSAARNERDEVVDVVDQLRYAANVQRLATVFYRG